MPGWNIARAILAKAAITSPMTAETQESGMPSSG